MAGEKYRVRCIGRTLRDVKDGHTVVIVEWVGCGWTGVRTDSIECECYDINALYCRPLTPGMGCPRGVAWPCPRCAGAVTGQPVQQRAVARA